MTRYPEAIPRSPALSGRLSGLSSIRPAPHFRAGSGRTRLSWNAREVFVKRKWPAHGRCREPAAVIPVFQPVYLWPPPECPPPE